MNEFKISVDVNLHFSEKTEDFILDLVKSIIPDAAKPAPVQAAKPAPVQAAKPAPVQAAKPAPVQAAKPAPVQAAKPAPVQAAKPAPAAPAATLTIDDVRKVVASKAATHRAEIKSKLTELGAANVTTLDPSLYSELVDYLNSLA